jgi:hypothetical protein
MPYYWITGSFDAGSRGPWTHELNIAPSSVYALANLNSYGQGGDYSSAVVGFLDYTTGYPDGVFTHTWPWVAPAINDQNVIQITLVWTCLGDSVQASGCFTVFLNLD